MRPAPWSPTKSCRVPATVAGLTAWALAAGAAEPQHDAADIAMQLNNPVAALISVPFQLNYDEGLGSTDEGERWLMNFQPVIPMSLSDDWNLISRTIVPLLSQDDVPPGRSDSGLGDVFQSFFFSPKAPSAGGWIWGVGPALLLPTASDERLGAEKWAVGPTAVALRQQSGWTYGVLANHVWSFAGDDDRSDLSSTFLQPFVAFTTKRHTTLTLNTESTYDWKGEQWSVPLNLLATQLFRAGGQLMSLQLGARYWVDAPETGAEGWGFRLTYTLVFPR